MHIMNHNLKLMPHRQMNAHIIYHVAQVKQAKLGSLVDRGANGGLAGSDVRVLSTSPRKCTVTGIDNHEIPGLDLVQCAALVQTNHGIVNLIMNECAFDGRGHSIHSILKIMGSLIGPLIPTKTFSLTPILMNSVIMSTDHCPYLTY